MWENTEIYSTFPQKCIQAESVHNNQLHHEQEIQGAMNQRKKHYVFQKVSIIAYYHFNTVCEVRLRC